MRRVSLIAFALLAAGNAPAGTVTPTPPEQIKEAEQERWSFSASATTYIVPDFHEYVQPTLTADRGWLHLETRYNYENLKTGSVWFGYNFSGGKKLEWEITPTLGGVLGDTMGVAPGYRLALTYWKLELASEGELVFDANGREESFFYNWSELSISPVEWLRFGLVGQRTRAYQTEVDIQRGLLLGFSYKEVSFTSYVFNLDQDKPTYVFSVGVTF